MSTDSKTVNSLDVAGESFYASTFGFLDDEETSSTSVGRRDKPITPSRFTARESHQRSFNGVSHSPGIFNTPTQAPSPSALSLSRNYGTRAKSGDVVVRYNCKDSRSWEIQTQCNFRWEIVANPFSLPQLTSNSKYMFQRTREMAIVLNDVVSDLTHTIIEYYSLGQPADLKDSTTEEEVFVGRVRSEGKLSGGSVLLEGTMESSSGHILALDLSQVEEYFIFPGQVLGLSGMNNLGRCIGVSKLFLPRPFPFPEGRININRTTGPISLLIASGPFTPTDSLQFEPLKDLITIVQQTRPDVCFLIGPFLDVSHPMISGEDTVVNETFDEIFERQLRILEELTGKTETQLILVSSWKDAHHHAVFPTLPYAIKNSNSIKAVSDPSVISIDGLMIGVSSTDILMHLSRNELANATILTDRMGRLVRHMLSQRSFYPLYPPDESVPLDVELWAEHAQMPTTPHILILPSDLRHFIKDVDGTVVVNPERLTKGQSGGTFARLLIELPNEAHDLCGVGDGSPVSDFIMGEVIKI